MLAASTISASLSRNGTPRRAASARPTAVLPAPIMPTITTVFLSRPPFGSAAFSVMLCSIPLMFS